MHFFSVRLDQPTLCSRSLDWSAYACDPSQGRQDASAIYP